MNPDPEPSIHPDDSDREDASDPVQLQVEDQPASQEPEPV